MRLAGSLLALDRLTFPAAAGQRHNDRSNLHAEVQFCRCQVCVRPSSEMPMYPRTTRIVPF
jgi:hypothetical protein